MRKTVGENIEHYRNYPRVVGETGGKDFIVAHPSSDLDAVLTAVVRGSFEYQGQKCSAASRVYAPSNLWPQLREALQEQVSTIRVGDVRDFRNFMGAVIDESSFATQRDAVKLAGESPDAEVVVGGDAKRCRQLLRERQADGRRRGPAAVRRLARVGHERQGRLDVESDPVGVAAHDQGDVRPGDRLPVPVHGRGVGPAGVKGRPA